jgi:hypothetical protein
MKMRISLSAGAGALSHLDHAALVSLDGHCDILNDWFQGNYVARIKEENHIGKSFLHVLNLLREGYPVTSDSITLYRGLVNRGNSAPRRYGSGPMTSWTTSRDSAVRFLNDVRSLREGRRFILSKTFRPLDIYCNRHTIIQFCNDLIRLIGKEARQAHALIQHLNLPSRVLQDEHICFTGNIDPSKDNT